MFVCTLSDRTEFVEYKGKTYWFEHTAWAGWVAMKADGTGAERDHPKGAWEILLKLDQRHKPEGGA